MNCSLDTGANLKRLFVVFAIMASYFVTQVIMAFQANATVLYADALHMLAHCGGILTAIAVLYIIRHFPKAEQKASAMGGLVNGGLLLGMAFMVFFHGLASHAQLGQVVQACMDTAAPDMIGHHMCTLHGSGEHAGHHGHHGSHNLPNALTIMMMAVIGLVVHAVCAYIIRKDSPQNLSIRGVLMNMIGYIVMAIGLFVVGLALYLGAPPTIDSYAAMIAASLMAIISIKLIVSSVKKLA